MATQVQFRRGTSSQNNAFTGAAGELTIDTDVWTLRIHDGTTQGGRSVPTLTAAQTFTNKTFGSNNTWNGNAIGLGYGGTGAAITAVAGAIVYSTGSALALSLAGTSGQVLTSGGTSGPTWVNASALSTGTATTATTATNISGGSAGYLVYQLDTDTTSFIAPGDSGYILRSTGASTAPEWVTSALTIGTTALQVGDTAASFDGLNILTATGTSHWKIPSGTTLQRPGSPAAGMIRYNTTQSTFEGYSSGAWSSLGGVKSVDALTYIIAETSAGASNGDLDFYAENSGGNAAQQVGQWNHTHLKDYTGTLVGSQTTQNVFNTTATTVNAFGAATTLSIGASTGTLTVNNAKTVFSSTDSIQIPVGTTAQRNGTPVTGMIRYNSSLSTFEGYASSSWGSLGGVKSVDGYTYVIAETSAGASNGELEFYVENADGNDATKAGGWNKDRILTNTRVDRSNGTNTISSDSVKQATVATTSQTAVDTFATATYRSAKYLVQITQGTDYQVSEILVIHNGTSTTSTEYAMMNTNGVLGTFATDISSGNARLLVTMGSATSATINITRTTLVV